MAGPQRKICFCLPVVERGCCCDLKTCNQVHAWLFLIGSALSIPFAFCVYADAKYVCDQLTKGMGKGCSSDQIHGLIALAGVLLFVLLGHIIISILFLRGISQNNPSKLLPYIYMFRFYFFFQIIGSVYVLFTRPADLIGTVLYAPLSIYIYMCAYSLYIHMKEGTLTPLPAEPPPYQTLA